MIQIEINGHEISVPTDFSEIKLSQFIEYNKLRSVVINMQNEIPELRMKVEALNKILEIPEEVIDDMTIGDYDPESKESTITKLYAMVDSTMMSYIIPVYDFNGYQFEYKDQRWVFPCCFNPDGTYLSNLKYGQYVMAMEAMRKIDQMKEKDKTGAYEFTGMLMLLASLCMPITRFDLVDGKYEFKGDLSIMEMKRINDQVGYWDDVNAQIGLDVNFFFRSYVLG